jgi:hypothetical protein
MHGACRVDAGGNAVSVSDAWGVQGRCRWKCSVRERASRGSAESESSAHVRCRGDGGYSSRPGCMSPRPDASETVKQSATKSEDGIRVAHDISLYCFCELQFAPVQREMIRPSAGPELSVGAGCRAECREGCSVGEGWQRMVVCERWCLKHWFRFYLQLI